MVTQRLEHAEHLFKGNKPSPVPQLVFVDRLSQLAGFRIEPIVAVGELATFAVGSDDSRGVVATIDKRTAGVVGGVRHDKTLFQGNLGKVIGLANGRDAKDRRVPSPAHLIDPRFRQENIRRVAAMVKWSFPAIPVVAEIRQLRLTPRRPTAPGRGNLAEQLPAWLVSGIQG